MAVSKQLVCCGPFKHYIANGVKSGNTIYLSGQVGMDSEGNLVGDGDLGARVRQCYANIKEVLARFDADMDNIVDEMWV